MKDRFYMICLRDSVGTNASFHCHNGQGYSTNIARAHIYTREEAQSAWDSGRNIDLPVAADLIDAQCVFHVDHQLIPCENTIESGCEQYVAFIKNEWDGNDVYWLAELARPTTDFTKAVVAKCPNTEDDGLVWIPFHTADAAKRRTFSLGLLDHRRMIQGAGLRVPEWLKQQRRRKPSSGKTRWNCPCCGKISWQHNPYDFEGCKNFSCDGWRKGYE